MPATADSRAPDLRLIHSNALDVLAGVLAERLQQPLDADLLRPEVVLIPQVSMRRWLQQFVAGQVGVCANVRFLTPGEFVDVALDANLGPAPSGDRLAPDTARWHVLRALHEAPPAEFAAFLADGDARKAWSLACGLAESFEKYQAWRRDLLKRWEDGAQPGDAQAQLWRRIGGGRAHRARRIGDYLRRFGHAARGQPRGLPPRLFVFACQNVSPDVLQVIVSQARAGTQEFFLHTPSREFWGDLGRWSAGYVPSEDDRHVGDAPNPLLAAWGQAGRDFIAALGSGDAVQARYEAHAFVEPVRKRLLGRLQADVLGNRAPTAADDDGRSGDGRRPMVDPDDASLQFHACHTRLREVQVLHDQLRALLEAGDTPGEPRLDARDIAVLAPDIDAYAPHIEAVFGGALGSARELPYTVADTSPLATAPLAEAFLRLLDVPIRALTVTDVMDLLAVPAIAERFDLDDAARATVQAWLEAAGARWGFDAGDRMRHGAGDENAYTFEFALDRLLLGYAAGNDAEIAGVAPWPELEGQSANTLDGLLRLLQVLRDATRRLAGPLSPQEWASELERALEAMVGQEPRDPGDRRSLQRLRETIGSFSDGASRAGFEAPVEHALVRDHLRGELAQADARAPFLSGGVCFGRMVPMRLIPFRVICLLGMDEAAFPARDARDPLNRIAQALDGPDRRVGDPSRRDADRYLFLQLFASAGRVFYVSWLGFDARDGTTREPSSVVAELLDVAAEYHQGDAAANRQALVVRHALQPFAPAAFGAAHAGETRADTRRFSFDARWRGAAGSEGKLEVPAAFATRLPAMHVESRDGVTLDQLRGALARPQAFYLQQGLGLRLPEDEPALLDHEPFGAPDALARHGLRQRVFEALLASNGALRPDALQARLLAEARLAPGPDGRATLAALLEEVTPFAEKARAEGFGAVPREARPYAFTIDGTRVSGVFDGLHPEGLFRAVLRSEGPHGGHVLRHRLEALVASLLGLQVHELSVGKKGELPRIATLPSFAPRDAEAALAGLLDLRRHAQGMPLPFLPKSGYLLAKADSEASGLQQARQQWLGGDYTQAEATAATGIALRGRDPFIDQDGDSLRRFVAVSHALYATLEDATPFDAGALA